MTSSYYVYKNCSCSFKNVSDETRVSNETFTGPCTFFTKLNWVYSWRSHYFLNWWGNSNHLLLGKNHFDIHPLPISKTQRGSPKLRGGKSSSQYLPKKIISSSRYAYISIAAGRIKYIGYVLEGWWAHPGMKVIRVLIAKAVSGSDGLAEGNCLQLMYSVSRRPA